MKAIGNRLTTHKVKSIDLLESLPYEEPEVEDLQEQVVEEEVDNTANSTEDETGEEDVAEKEADSSDDISAAVEEPKAVIEPPKEEKKPNPIKDVDDDEENQMTLF